MAANTKIEVYKGDTKTINITVTDEDGDEQNILGCTVILTVKRRDTDADSEALLQDTFTVRDQSVYEGQATVTLSASDTGDLDAGVYVYDIELSQGAGPTTRQTVAKGVFEVRQDVYHHA